MAKPSLTLVRPGPQGLTLDQTLQLFTKLSGREPTPEEVDKLREKFKAREAAKT